MKSPSEIAYIPVIGLEVHAQLSTRSKIYAADSNAYGSEPNTDISVITLAHPGTLPKMNRRALEFAIAMGLACGSEISRYNIFCRKNYFYPDLPKGFQLTQDKTPICIGGTVRIRAKDGISREIALNRIHIEEDAGKSLHQSDTNDTYIDLNRAGVPLIEIVTEPVIRNSEEASQFLAEVRRLLRYLGICDGNMEEGSLRCDANVSVMPAGSAQLGQKVEIKNMNSIRNVRKAIDHEIERQIGLLVRGKAVAGETRTWQADAGDSVSMREKEDMNDYRYFPEPDLSPVMVSDEWLESIRRSMPVLPWEREERFQSEYGLSAYDAQVLSESRELAEYTEGLLRCVSHRKAAANWIIGPVKGWLNENQMDIAAFPLDAGRLAGLIELVESGRVSYTAAAQKIFPALLEKSESAPLEVATKLNLLQRDEAGFLDKAVEEVVECFPEKVMEYRKGKKGLVGFFMGEVMRRTGGRVDPKQAQKLIAEALEKA